MHSMHDQLGMILLQENLLRYFKVFSWYICEIDTYQSSEHSHSLLISHLSSSYSQQTKLYYRNIITILSFAVFNISSAYYGKDRAGKHDIY